MLSFVFSYFFQFGQIVKNKLQISFFNPNMQVTLCFLFACCKMTSSIAIYFNDLTHLTETDESLTTAVCCVIMTILAADESKKQVTEF